MLVVLLIGKKYENPAHARNDELTKTTRVLDLKPRSPVYWRSKCKTISLTGVYFFYLTKARPRGTLIAATRQLLPWNHFLTPPQLSVSSGNRAEWKENYLEKIFEKFGFTSRGCRVCLGTSGNADPVTTGSCRKFKPEVLVVLVHKYTVLSKGVFSDVRQSQVDFLHSWASSLRENTVTAQTW